MNSWVIPALWLIALGALTYIMMLPDFSVDLYVHDTYVVVSKMHLIFAMVVLIVPLLVITIAHFR